MTECGHHHHITTLALYVVPHISKFGTWCDKIIQEDIVYPFLDLTFKTYTFANPWYVRSIGMGDVCDRNDIMFYIHPYCREFCSVSSRYHIDLAVLHLVIISYMGVGIASCNIANFVILNQVVDQTYRCIIISMFCCMEIRMFACYGRTGMIDNSREIVTPSHPFWHIVFLL